MSSEHGCTLHFCELPQDQALSYSSTSRPGDGAAFPADEHANDVVHRQTVLVTPHGNAAATQLSSVHAKFVSSGVVAESHGQLGFQKAFLVRDPDGHAILVEEK